MDENPYRSPEEKVEQLGSARHWLTNRGLRAMLFLTAMYGLMIGLPGLLVGAFVGPQVLIAAVCHLVIGGAAAYFLRKKST